MVCSCRRSIGIGVLVLALCWSGQYPVLVAPGDLLAEDGDDAPVHLAFPVKVGRPILGKPIMEMKGDIEVETDDFFWSDDIEWSRDVVFIDEYEKISKTREVYQRQ